MFLGINLRPMIVLVQHVINYLALTTKHCFSLSNTHFHWGVKRLLYSVPFLLLLFFCYLVNNVCLAQL